MTLPLVRDTAAFDLKAFQTYEKALRKRVDAGKIPGYCSAVVYKGKLLHSDAYGYADPARRLRYGPDVLCRLYCMSKPFVAVGVLILQERGLLSVRDAVAKYLPCFKHVTKVSRPSAVFQAADKRPRPFTILHCLTHTTGLTYGTDFNRAPSSPSTKMCDALVQRTESGQIGSLEQFVNELAQLPLRFEPGKEYSYSYSIDVLCRVIEVVSGMKISAFLEKELFRPLGMKSTSFSFTPKQAHKLAALFAGRHSAVDLGQKLKDLPRSKHALCRIDGQRPKESKWCRGNHCKVESGGGMMGANMGGLISTVNDCARFFGMLACGGALSNVRILQEATVKSFCMSDLLPKVITSGRQQRSNGVPFGWTALGEIGVPLSARDPKPDTKDSFEVGEVGGGGAACTYWSINPCRDLAIVWFTQCMDNDPYVKEEENIYVAVRKAVPRSCEQQDRRRVKKSILKKKIGLRR